MRCTCDELQNAADPTPYNTNAAYHDILPLRPCQQIVFDARGSNVPLEWVPSSQSSQTSVRTRVRSHVMRRFRAQQALGQQQSPQQLLISAPAQRPLLVSRRSGAFPDYDSRIEHYYMCATCGQLNPKPCNSTTTDQDVESHIQILSQPLPVNPTAESGQLYQYLTQVYAFIQNPVRRNGIGLVQYCFPFIISSAAVLNSILSLAATHRMLVGGNNPAFTAAYYHHKVEAIQIINQSIALHVNTVTSDILVAIAILAIIEYTIGSIENAQKHITGLQQIMVSNGPAAAAPASNYLALRLMNLAKMLTSNAAQTSAREAKMDEVLRTLPQNTHSSIHNMFGSLQHLCATMPRESGDIAQQAEWLDRLNVAEFEMHRVLENDLSLHTMGGSSSFAEWRAYPIAGNIFLCLWLRQLSLQSNVFDYLVDSLAHALEEEEQLEGYILSLPENSEEAHYPSIILIWLLFVGGAAAEGRRNRQWFLVRISQILRKLNLNSWLPTKELLMTFPYVEECEGPFRTIWEELQRAKLVE